MKKGTINKGWRRKGSEQELTVPTREDWLPITLDSLMDEGCAIRHFYGKSLSEAIDMFWGDSFMYAEDLLHMTPIPTRYYLYAYEEYLLSRKSKEDCDGASYYFTVISHLVEFDWEVIARDWNRIARSVDSISCNQVYYDAEADIYGDFLSRAKQIYEMVPNYA